MSEGNLAQDAPSYRGGDSTAGSSSDYLAKARICESHGNTLGAIYQLLCAYELAQDEFRGSLLFEGHPALEGLFHAWDLACELDDHGLAEHLFSLVEPYVPLEDMERFAGRLEGMALGKLGEFGFTQKDVEDVASAITRDIMNAATGGEHELPGGAGLALTAKGEDEPTTVTIPAAGYTYDTLVGFDDEVARLRDMGFGADSDPAFQEFIAQMMAQHGIDTMPATGTLLFSCPAREDADRLMLATANELGRPCIRMRLEEGSMGASVLCVMATGGVTANGFSGPGVLVLEGVDTWSASIQPASDFMPFDMDFSVGLSRGAMKALALIRMAVADPQVSVFVSTTAGGEIDPLLANILGPWETIEVPLPNDEERDAIWDYLMDAHTSLSALDRFELVRLSEGMPRCDIFAAAHEAVMQAYRQSVSNRVFIPVTRDNLLDKIAAYQPLDSKQYREIENSIVEDLLDEIERYERGERG